LKEREERLKARENAIWEREAKKKQQQLRIAKEREDRKKRRLDGGHKDEHSEDEIGRHQEEEEEEDWVFDCVCGVFGNNLVSDNRIRIYDVPIMWRLAELSYLGIPNLDLLCH